MKSPRCRGMQYYAVSVLLDRGEYTPEQDFNRDIFGGDIFSTPDVMLG
jgi:hypothetical protein